MSQAIIFAIRIYQFTLSPLVVVAFGPTAGCRYEISCSAYAIRALQAHGALRGGLMSAKRILSCI